MNKTVSSVIDDINEWNGPNGTIYYVTAIFTDESVGSVGKKDHDAALEVQGLLREAIGQELDFTLEPKGQTKSGREKFNIKGFGTPGGAATYTAPGVQGSGETNVASGSSAARITTRQASGLDSNRAPRSRSPEPSREQASIRASVALKAAVDAVPKNDINLILEYADAFNAWMLEKTSEPALSAYRTTVEDDSPVSTPAGASSETTSPAVRGAGSTATAAPAGGTSSDPAGISEPVEVGSESGGGVETMGKEAAPPPHEHDWQPHPNLHGWLSCECGENRKKYAP